MISWSTLEDLRNPHINTFWFIRNKMDLIVRCFMNEYSICSNVLELSIVCYNNNHWRVQHVLPIWALQKKKLFILQFLDIRSQTWKVAHYHLNIHIEKSFLERQYIQKGHKTKQKAESSRTWFCDKFSFRLFVQHEFLLFYLIFWPFKPLSRNKKICQRLTFLVV